MKRFGQTLLFSLAMGFLYGLVVCLYYTVHDPFIYSGGPIPMSIFSIVLLSVIQGLVYGIAMGLLAAPGAGVLLRRKDLWSAMKSFALAIIGVSVLFAYLDAPSPSGRQIPNPNSSEWTLFAFLPLFYVLCGIAWRVLPNIEDRDYPVCAECSYNLTGNISGICPECGTEVRA